MVNHSRLEELGKNKFLINNIILVIMTLAFLFGYMDLVISKNFERLHIFLFNLTSGGFIIIFYTENYKFPSITSISFLALSIAYAMMAFFEIYPLAVVLSLTLFLLTEYIRIKKFSFFPGDFFNPRIFISKKFHQASLICLSYALLFSSIVILNNKYYNWLHFDKLSLNVFFLGFSFPVSLITLSIIFSFTRKPKSGISRFVENFSFWSINLGVIVFFIFIILKVYALEILCAVILFLTVVVIFIYFFRFGKKAQEKYFLVSGIFFLLGTGFSGILYIVITKLPIDFINSGLLLKIHAYLSLYGWNLTGLMVILRKDDFPLKLDTFSSIFFHWLLILILAPLGKGNIYLAALSVVLYAVFLVIFFYGTGRSYITSIITKGADKRNIP